MLPNETVILSPDTVVTNCDPGVNTLVGKTDLMFLAVSIKIICFGKWTSFSLLNKSKRICVELLEAVISARMGGTSPDCLKFPGKTMGHNPGMAQ